MSTFPLRIGTPDGLLFEGDVERVVCRSIGGDIAILARHCNFCTALGMGEASVVMADGNRRTAACIGGLTDQEYKMASAKLQRALVRLSVKE